MPLFEYQYVGEARLPDGRIVRLPPARGLWEKGPVLQVAISVTNELTAKLASEGKHAPQPVTGFALIDTGASLTAVDETVCRRLELVPTSTILISHAGGSEDRPCYPIQVLFPGTPIRPVIIARACSVSLAAGKQSYILLLGRDFLSRYKMVYHGPAGRIELDF